LHRHPVWIDGDIGRQLSRLDLLLHNARQIRVEKILDVFQADNHGVVGCSQGLVVDTDDLEHLAPQFHRLPDLGVQSLGNIGSDTALPYP